MKQLIIRDNWLAAQGWITGDVFGEKTANPKGDRCELKTRKRGISISHPAHTNLWQALSQFPAASREFNKGAEGPQAGSQTPAGCCCCWKTLLQFSLCLGQVWNVVHLQCQQLLQCWGRQAGDREDSAKLTGLKMCWVRVIVTGLFWLHYFSSLKRYVNLT